MSPVNPKSLLSAPILPYTGITNPSKSQQSHQRSDNANQPWTAAFALSANFAFAYGGGAYDVPMDTVAWTTYKGLHAPSSLLIPSRQLTSNGSYTRLYFRIPQYGIYHFLGQMGFTNTNAGYAVPYIWINGSNLISTGSWVVSGNSTQTTNMEISYYRYCSPGDIIQFVFGMSVTGTFTTNTYGTDFFIRYLGPT